MRCLSLVLTLTLLACSSPAPDCSNDPPAPVQQQLIQNGDFEEYNYSSTDPLPHWKTTNCTMGSSDMTVTTETFYTGVASLKLVTRLCGIISHYDLPSGASTYQLSMYSRINYWLGSGTAGGCSGECVRATLYWLSLDGGKVGTDTYYMGPYDNKGTFKWKLENFAGSIPTGAVAVDVELMNTRASYGTGYWNGVDDIQLLVE